MKKPYQQKPQYIHSETLNLPHPERNDYKLFKESKIGPSSLIKAGIFAIKNDKKHSILSVPKHPVCYPQILKENKIPESITPDIHPIHIPILFSNTPKPLSTASFESNSSQICKSARKSILTLNRYRKNPNIDTLKLALEEVMKNPPKSKEKKEEFPEILSEKLNNNDKSDIEKLIESQQSGLIPMKKLKKIYIQTTLNTEKSDDNVSQKSDPSPVREKLPALYTDSRGNSQKVLKNKKKSDKLSKELRKIMIMNKMPLVETCKVQSNSFNIENNENYSKFDYQLESLRILKNTSSFANKIMRTIRQPARNRNC